MKKGGVGQKITGKRKEPRQTSSRKRRRKQIGKQPWKMSEWGTEEGVVFQGRKARISQT